MKKIVFVIEQLYGGGAERVTAALMNEMCKQPDYEIHLVTYFGNEQKDYFTDEKIARHNMKQSTGSRINQILQRIMFLRDTVKEINPYCVISLGTPRIVFLLSIVLFGSNIPLILSERNDPRRFPKTFIWRCLRNCAYVLCDGLVFQTQEAMNYFPAFIRKKGITICNPITGNLIARYEGDREPRIVNWCRLDSQKNLELLVESFYEVVKTFPEYSLHIYGEGPEKDRLEKKVLNLGLGEKVFLHGYSNHIYEDVYKAALFVSSSDYEGISNSMLEAIALGVPSICTDCPVGGARETIENGINGILVPTRDKTEMINAIKLVLSDNKLSLQLSKNGSQLRNKLSVKAIEQKWRKYIDEIVKKF